MDLEARGEVEPALAALGMVVPFGLWVCDRDGRPRWANDAWYGITGRTTLGDGADGWITAVAPDHAARVARSWAAFVGGDDDAWHEELEFLRPDGTRAHTREDARRERDADGRTTRIVGATLDLTGVREIEDMLRRHLDEADQLAGLLPSGVWRASPDGAVTYASERWLEITGQAPDDALGDGWRAVVHRDDLPLLDIAWEAAVREHATFRCEFRAIRAGGPPRTLLTLAVPVEDDAGGLTGFLGCVVDLAGTGHADELARRAARDAALSQLGRVALEPGSRLEHVLAEAVRLVTRTLGASSAIRGHSPPDAPPPGSPGAPRGAVASTQLAVSEAPGGDATPDALTAIPILVGDDAFGRLEVRLGEPALRRDDIAFLETVAQLLASAIERARATHGTRRQRRTDELTGIANRSRLEEVVARLLARRDRPDAQVAVLFVGLDRFGAINEQHGHAAGDELLRAVARRLTAQRRPGDLLARFGGDEFVLVCAGLGAEADAVAVGRRLVGELRRPIPLRDGEPIEISASVGIALARPHETTADRLIRDAQIAMHRGKRRGPGELEVFDPAMRGHLLWQAQLEQELRRAIERGELRALFQPVCAVPDGELEGFEALVRWQHRTRGLLPPGEFIAAAEASGLVVPLGAWMLREACACAAAWPTPPGGVAPSVSVNVAAAQLETGEALVEAVREALRTTGLAPSRLALEVTETTLIPDPEAVGATLDALRALGAHVFLDDFGAGWSSLHHLRVFAVDAIKIDRSFVMGMLDSPKDAEIVRAVAGVGRALGVAVMAEGVETPEHLAAVHAAGCTRAQGFLLARPLPADEAAALVARAPRWPAG